MADSKWQRLYHEEAGTLGRIGEVLARVDMPRIDVRIPSELAKAAVASWQRTGDESAGPAVETCEQRLERHRAAALSLIGLAIKERGRWDDDGVTVALHPSFIGSALDAADDLPAA